MNLSNSSFLDFPQMNDICNKEMRYATLLFLNTSHNIYVVQEKTNIGGTRPQKNIHSSIFNNFIFRIKFDNLSLLTDQTNESNEKPTIRPNTVNYYNISGFSFEV